MCKWLVLTGLFPLLAGCGMFVNRQELAAKDDAYCASIGVPQASAGYADCRLRVEQMRQQRVNAAIMAPR